MTETIRRDGEYGELICPIFGCGEPLGLNRRGWIPLHAPESPPFGASPGHPFTDAITDGWTVECAAMHVLLVSEGEESAEPFVLNDLLLVLEALAPLADAESTYRRTEREASEIEDGMGVEA